MAWGVKNNKSSSSIDIGGEFCYKTAIFRRKLRIGDFLLLFFGSLQAAFCISESPIWIKRNAQSGDRQHTVKKRQIKSAN